MPVALLFNFLTRNGKAFKPHGYIAGSDTAEVATVRNAVEIQVCTAADHQIIFGEEILGHIRFKYREKLPAAAPHDRF